jgi:hypothetical protein
VVINVVIQEGDIGPRSGTLDYQVEEVPEGPS